MRDKIMTLLTRHQQTLRNETAEIGEAILRLNDLDPEELDVLVRQVHTLKGSSGSLGFDQIFQSSQALEHRMRACLAGDPWSSAASEIGDLFAALEALVADLRIEQSTLHAKFA